MNPISYPAHGMVQAVLGVYRSQAKEPVCTVGNPNVLATGRDDFGYPLQGKTSYSGMSASLYNQQAQQGGEM